MRLLLCVLGTLAMPVSTASAAPASRSAATTPRPSADSARAAVTRLGDAGIATLGDLAAADSRALSRLDPALARRLRAAARATTARGSLVSPRTPVRAGFVMEPSFVVDPMLASDRRAQRRLAAAARLRNKLVESGVVTYTAVARSENRRLVERAVGRRRAAALIAAAVTIVRNTSPTSPRWIVPRGFADSAITSAFVADPTILVGSAPTPHPSPQSPGANPTPYPGPRSVEGNPVPHP